MSYPFNYPTPVNADIQIFSEPNNGNNGRYATWTKPIGASFVWFTLIGGGGGGGSSSGVGNGGGGGSGAVTNCMVPAFLIPDELSIIVGYGGTGANGGGLTGATGGSSSVNYLSYSNVSGNANGFPLLNGNGGIGGNPDNGGGGTGGTANISNQFSSMGFYQSIAGQDGTSASISASTTTFLSGGGASSGVTPNYGYPSTAVVSNVNGYFIMQPIIVGCGGIATNSSAASGKGGIGCGGGGAANATSAAGGPGGNGLVVIITW